MAIIRSVVGVILKQPLVTGDHFISFRFFHASSYSLNNIRRIKERMAAKSKNVQPPWSAPEGTEVPKLKLYNSLTRQKEVFVPQSGRRVLWYSCGPTVYDSSHMGHARSFISIDILRRVLQDYFNYEVFYCMNITDIDDKIIKRARQNHLYEQYLNKNLALSKILEDVESAMKPFIVKLEKEEDPDKKGMYVKIKAKVEKALSEVKASQDEGQSRERLCVDGKDVLCDWLDKTHGSEVTDNSIFARLPQFFEEDFHKDMEALNVSFGITPEVAHYTLKYFLNSAENYLIMIDIVIDKKYLSPIGKNICKFEFFLNVKNLLRTTPGTGVAAFEKWNPEDVELNKKYLQTKDAVHEALCDNVNTRTALESLRELIGEANIYMANARGANRTPNRMILKNIASYIMYLLKVFGAIEVEEEIGFPQSTTQNVNIEEAVMPFLSAFAQFREDVRTISREQKATGILKLCDELRDDVLPNLGVRLEDGISPPTIKLVDRDTLMKEREEKLKKEELKRLEKEKKKQEMEAKLAQEKIPPWELFKKETDKYSQFDDKGIPTHDAEGKEISKGQIKKLTKLYEKQEKSYNKHMGITGKEGGS
eukprot:XP_019929569.1 PREDICTED: cysteine--tRNA ligase, cytoplasmic [Crassostrea gigas]